MSDDKKITIGARWLGNAEIVGVPARTLNAGEYGAFAPLIRDAEQASGIKIYEPLFDTVPSTTTTSDGTTEEVSR